MVVEASSGIDLGVVAVVGELARIQVRKKSPLFKHVEARKILSIANQKEMDQWIKGRSLEKDIMFEARKLALNLKLNMKISDVEYQGDLSKVTFYYTAEDRVDFRQLIKDMAESFKVRIEMRQIGSRQEASKLGGIGSCGRELCCSTWLTDFRSVSTSAARYQQLSLNPQKLAGQCGKLKCCLNYELDMYLDAIKGFPKAESKLKTSKGEAYHVKTDVFKRQMWYAFPGEMGLVVLTPERVRKIQEMNKAGNFPPELKDFEKSIEPIKEVGYDNVVGQDSINRFENKKRPSKNRNNRNNNRNPNRNPNQNPKGPDNNG